MARRGTVYAVVAGSLPVRAASRNGHEADVEQRRTVNATGVGSMPTLTAT